MAPEETVTGVKLLLEFLENFIEKIIFRANNSSVVGYFTSIVGSITSIVGSFTSIVGSITSIVGSFLASLALSLNFTFVYN